MNPNDLYAHLHVDKDLVTGFSIMFSRIEYCLKRIPKYASDRGNSVEANWDDFAKDHDTSFNPKRIKPLENAVEYLTGNPPLKQVLINGVLDLETNGKAKYSGASSAYTFSKEGTK